MKIFYVNDQIWFLQKHFSTFLTFDICFSLVFLNWNSSQFFMSHTFAMFYKIRKICICFIAFRTGVFSFFASWQFMWVSKIQTIWEDNIKMYRLILMKLSQMIQLRSFKNQNHLFLKCDLPFFSFPVWHLKTSIRLY